jgi:hypothetical integral membrane protein (TIGR02206 family)
MSAPFVLLGRSHIIVIALTFVVPLVLIALSRRNPRLDPPIRYGLALLLLGGWTCWYILFAMRGWLGIGNALPLNLCDWAAIALIVAMLKPNQFSYELGYFWGLGGTLHGVVTPPVHHEFPDPEFIFFFINHCGIIASLLYLTLGAGLRPYLRSLPRVIAASLGYAAVAGTADWLLGVNYGLLRAKPDNVSILDMLSPWPTYIPELIGIGILSVFFYYTPFAVYDALSGRRRKMASLPVS